jgi:uncharacterized protein
MNRMEMTLQSSGATAQRGLLVSCASAVVLIAAAGLPSVFFTLLVAAPVLEEVVFRTGLQTQLLRRVSVLSANVLSALAFAAAHVVVRPSVLSALTFFPALMVGALFERQRRVLPCIALHAACNAVWLALFEFTV